MTAKQRVKRPKFRLNMKRYWQCYLMIAIPLLLLLIFNYIPMGGVLLAFENYSFRRGILGSEWVGLEYFQDFFSNPIFPRLIQNTLSISLYSLIASFPIPIVLALVLNECKHPRYRKAVQLVTYAPNFISTVILVGMVMQFLHPRFGIVNNLLALMGVEAIDFMAKPALFSSIYVWSGVWQGAGYGSIIYIAALGSVDQELVEATLIEGANRLQRIWHIDLPAIRPTIVISLILSVGGIMGIGFEKIFLLQNNINAQVSEVISTYVYKRGMIQNEYGYATAVGLFNSVINMALLVAVNRIAKRVNETSLW